MVFKFTIDNWLNPYLWPNQVSRFGPVKRLLGGHSPKPVADYWVWLEILVASFCGIALLEGVFISNTVFSLHHAPMIVASYGATAILCFNAALAPLAQPRNILVGHFVSSLIGVCIQKLFNLSVRGQDHYWASGALSVALLSVAMSVLNCVHPPAGASALLPSADEQIRLMGWWYLPVQLVSSVLIICVACITGNVVRSYPVYWWTAGKVGKPEQKPMEEKIEPVIVSESLDIEHGVEYIAGAQDITISQTKITVPGDLQLDDIQLEWLDTIQKRLAQLSEV